MSTTTSNGHASTLFPSHLADLRRSGLTDETIAASGIYSEHDRRKMASMLNWKDYSQALGPGMVIPYFSADGTRVLCRVKLERPRIRAAKPLKYLTPTGTTSRIYFPPGVYAKLATAVEVIITEGEKTTLRAVQDGFCAVGLPGVDNWHGRKSTALHSDFECITWAGRTVFIIFDSDSATNGNVSRNVVLLAAALKSRGANIKVVNLPAGPNGEKVGLDDYLVAHGAGALRRLMDTAELPSDVPPDVAKAEAHEADPADVAEKFCQSVSIEGDPRLRWYRGETHSWERGSYRPLLHDDLAANLLDFIRRDYFNVRREHVANALMHLKSLTLVGGHIEAPTWLKRQADDWPPLECISTRSGIVHLPSFAAGLPYLKPATPRFFTTTGVDYPFDEQAPQPVEFLKFLASVWGDDTESIDMLREFFGYLLTQDTSQQKLLMIVGPKRSGKGTILRILRALVGAANVAAPTFSSLCERFGLWPLLGKSVAIISDARLSGRADQAIIVERILSIAGEDCQTIDRKNLPPVTAKLPTRFVIVTNELPRLSDASGALVSRMLLLRTTNSFYGHEDHELTDRLLSELPGILVWAIQGWQRLQERGRSSNRKPVSKCWKN